MRKIFLLLSFIFSTYAEDLEDLLDRCYPTSIENEDSCAVKTISIFIRFAPTRDYQNYSDMQKNFFRPSNWYFSWNMRYSWTVWTNRRNVCGNNYWKTCWKRRSSQYWKLLLLCTKFRKSWCILRPGCKEGFQSLFRPRLNYNHKISRSFMNQNSHSWNPP